MYIHNYIYIYIIGIYTLTHRCMYIFTYTTGGGRNHERKKGKPLILYAQDTYFSSFCQGTHEAVLQQAILHGSAVGQSPAWQTELRSFFSFFLFCFFSGQMNLHPGPENISTMVETIVCCYLQRDLIISYIF